MNPRVNIRVSMNGNKPEYELMADGMKVQDLSYLDIIDLISKATERLKSGRNGETFDIAGESLSFVETIHFQMQAVSSLRWTTDSYEATRAKAEELYANDAGGPLSAADEVTILNYMKAAAR